MQSLSDPLGRLHEDGAWFARAHELRLWLVRCDADLRGPALALIPGLEFHADNFSPWTLLLDAHAGGDGGWPIRANRLLAEWERRVEAFAAAGLRQGDAGPPRGEEGLAAFAGACAAVLAAMQPPLAGLVVVLAPGVVERAEDLASALAGLVGAPALAKVRWVLVLDVDAPPPAALVEALGPERAQVTACAVDPAAQRRELAAMLAADDPARFGMAHPAGAQPPRRVDDPPALAKETRDAALRAAGVPPALVEEGPRLRALVLGAALSLAEGRGESAIEQQRAACSLCRALGLTELQIVAQVALASYLSGQGQRDEAKRELCAAIAVARAHGLLRAESQAHLALGLLHALDRAPGPAIRAYVDAARAAEAGESPALAIEAWRMAGQLAAQSREEAQAVAAFREALRLATALAPELARASSASEAARQLAELYAERGMATQAASLHAQADALEEAADARQ